MGVKKRPPGPKPEVHSIPGQVENRLAKMQAAWQMRCGGRYIRALVSPSPRHPWGPGVLRRRILL